MMKFDELGLSGPTLESLKKIKFESPTPIQQQAIPVAMQGKDILGSAQTGTGKTAAFSIPLIEHVLHQPGALALVITPTRELASQVLDSIHQILGRKSYIKTALIIGGSPFGKQFSQLEKKPQIIVGTPGRINDHIERGTLRPAHTSFLVLDETDRMLDMGFGIQIDEILEHIENKPQTLLFSATLPKEITRLANKYLTEPERISVGETNTIAKNIEQEVLFIEQGKKYQELTRQLKDRNGSVIVFAQTKRSSDKIAKNLKLDGFKSEALHGDLKQSKRTRIVQDFRKMKFRILVATDVAARGLDVPHIEHVINYDLPQVPEDYIHRMGRTARAGSSGSALCFVASDDKGKWAAIRRMLSGKSNNDNSYHQRGPRKKDSRRSDRSRGERRRRDFNKPEGARRSSSRDGDSRTRSFSRDNDDRRKSSSRSVDDRKRSFNRDGDNRKRSFSRDGDDRKRSFSRDGDDRKRSFSRSGDDRKRSFSRDGDNRKRSFNRDGDDRRKSSRSGDDRKRSFSRDGDDRRKSSRSGDDRKRSFSRDSDDRRRSSPAKKRVLVNPNAKRGSASKDRKTISLQR